MAATASREEILTHLVSVLGTISGVNKVFRNRGLIVEEDAPAIMMLDGSEEAVSNIVPMKTVRLVPMVMRMKPQFFVILKKRDDASNTTVDGVDNPVGPEMNFWRDAVLAAINGDLTLRGMLTTTGQIVYRGMETDMQTGSTMQGQIHLMIDFHYVWQPPG